VNLDQEIFYCMIKIVFMFPKKYRINKDLFEKIFKTGKTFSFEYLILKITSLSTPNSLFTFVVSSKISKKSVFRNRLKRRARHIVKKLLPLAKPGFGAIIFFKPGSEKLTFQNLEKILQESLKKTKIL